MARSMFLFARRALRNAAAMLGVLAASCSDDTRAQAPAPGETADAAPPAAVPNEDAATDSALPPIADASTCFPTPYGSTDFGFWFLEQDTAARRWIVDDAIRQRSKFTASGATRSNDKWEQHAADASGQVPELAIEGQRGGAALIAAGLVQVLEHPDDATYTADGSLLDVGLKAIEWALAQRSRTETAGFACNDTNNPDVPPNATANIFPCERGGTKSGSHSIHPKTDFIHAAAEGIELILAAGTKHLPPSYLDRINAPGKVKDQLIAVGTWLQSEDVDKGDVRDFRKGITQGATYEPTYANFNQQLFVAAALFKVGKVVGDATFVQTAQDWMENPTYGVLKEERIVSGSSPQASVLPENAYVQVGLDGFDASYQTVSIDLLVDVVGSLAVGTPFRDQRLVGVLERAVRRFDASVVKPAGSEWQVDGAHARNTRTCECGPRAPGAGEVTMPVRMIRYGLLLGTMCSEGIVAKAEAVHATGQTFGHYQDCSSAGRDDGDLCVDPF